MTLEIQIFALDRHKHVAGLDWLIGPNPLLENNWWVQTLSWRIIEGVY